MCSSDLGYAPVGMTIHLGNITLRSHAKLSSRPERSVVKGSAVRLSDFPNSAVLTHDGPTLFCAVAARLKTNPNTKAHNVKGPRHVGAGLITGEAVEFG